MAGANSRISASRRLMRFARPSSSNERRLPAERRARLKSVVMVQLLGFEWAANCGSLGSTDPEGLRELQEARRCEAPQRFQQTPKPSESFSSRAALVLPACETG